MRTEDRDRSTPPGYGNREPDPKPVEPDAALDAALRDMRDAVAALAALMAGIADQVPGAHVTAVQLRRLKASLG